MTAQPYKSRPAQFDDYWAIHRFLTETTAISPVGFNGDIRRWEGKRFYDSNPAGNANWHRDSLLWQRTNGQLIAVAHPDGPGNPALFVHPDYRHVEPEMIAWAEEHLTRSLEDGQYQIQFYVYDYDVYRQRILAERGYKKQASGGAIRRLRLGQQPLAKPVLVQGYSLRTSNPADISDARHIAELLNAAFNRAFHNAAEYQRFASLAPSFQPELDLVVIAPDGAYAAYAGIPYDQTNKMGIFEPVCTHPDHRRKGLARALMQEGLRRLKALGAQYAMVDTGDMVAANRLYSALGFSEMYRGYYWRRTFGGWPGAPPKE